MDILLDETWRDEVAHACPCQAPGLAETVKPHYDVTNYYSIARVNPTGILPTRTPVDFGQPHDRTRLAA